MEKSFGWLARFRKLYQYYKRLTEVLDSLPCACRSQLYRGWCRKFITCPGSADSTQNDSHTSSDRYQKLHTATKKTQHHPGHLVNHLTISVAKSPAAEREKLNQLATIDVEKFRADLEKRMPPKQKRFRLDDIPNVMRSRLGWSVAAALMDRWFKTPAYVMPDAMKSGLVPSQLNQLNAAQLDEHTVKMGWALSYARVHAAMVKLHAKWASPAGIIQLKRRVSEQGVGRSAQCWQLGNLTQPAKILDKTSQVNFERIGHFSDPMDDFYGAMGEATLKVAVSGIVTPMAQGKAAIVIDELGFYLRDSYEFNDDSFVSQPLGFWSFNGVERNPQLALDVPTNTQWIYGNSVELRSQRYLVQNKHFRQWRIEQGYGGDFMILSDVHRVRLATPVRIEW